MRGDLIRRPFDMSLMRAGGIFFPVHFAPCKECVAADLERSTSRHALRKDCVSISAANLVPGGMNCTYCTIAA